LNRLFFPTTDPLTGKLLAIGTIGGGFFVRPLGAIVLSHFGDRVGRRRVDGNRALAPNRRGFYGSIVQIGFPLGMAIGTASFFALARLDDAQFMSWGWRLPFLVSAVLVVVGTFIRLRIEETPDFKRNVREGHIARFPVLLSSPQLSLDGITVPRGQSRL
jgi:MFS transporter, MHS family, shikimate and dehydroshikimate transport protein